MIDEVNIGKRIRMLRKQKRVSQERMAEDLGMYQADISNLERAMGGSGITDLFKLDKIAEYFGISLVELLSGSDPSPVILSSDTDSGMKNDIIKEVKYGSLEDYYYAEVCLQKPDQKEEYISFVEFEEMPSFYQSSKSHWKLLPGNSGIEKIEKQLKKDSFLSGENYIDIFENIEPKWVGICRYLIFVATEEEMEVKQLIDNSKGKRIGDITIPLPSREPEDLFNVNYTDLSVVYRYRLMVEADIKNPSVFSEVDNVWRLEKMILNKLKAACTSEEAYKVWKKDLIDAKLKEVMEKQKIVVCDYLFAGMGQYKEIMPEEMVESFKCWINHTGSGFFISVTPATKRQIRTYVSQHIADDLLKIDSALPR